MEGWTDFYMLVGSTAGTLIGLIFVVITLGMERAHKDDELRTRLYVTPTLVHFTALVVIALTMIAPLAPATRAFILAALGCAGLFYVANVSLTSWRRRDLGEPELLWETLFPILSYVLVTAAAAAWALNASFAAAIGAVASALLLVTALRNSWITTLVIGGRAPKE